MRLVTTDAIVLRSYNLAEADRIVLCLTRSAGLIRAVAKGARRMKSRFGAALEPFTLLRLSFHEKENRDLVTISAVDILKSYFQLSSKLEALESLAYMAELVNEFAPPHEADEKLFRMLAACVEALANSDAREGMILRYFDVWLLRLAGLFPDLGSCSKCGAGLAEDETTFVDDELRASCQRCPRNGFASISPDVVRAIRATQRLSPAQFIHTEPLSERDSVQLGDITARLISRAIGRR